MSGPSRPVLSALTNELCGCHPFVGSLLRLPHHAEKVSNRLRPPHRVHKRQRSLLKFGLGLADVEPLTQDRVGREG